MVCIEQSNLSRGVTSNLLYSVCACYKDITVPENILLSLYVDGHTGGALYTASDCMSICLQSTLISEEMISSYGQGLTFLVNSSFSITMETGGFKNQQYCQEREIKTVRDNYWRRKLWWIQSLKICHALYIHITFCICIIPVHYIQCM